MAKYVIRRNLQVTVEDVRLKPMVGSDHMKPAQYVRALRCNEYNAQWAASLKWTNIQSDRKSIVFSGSLGYGWLRLKV